MDYLIVFATMAMLAVYVLVVAHYFPKTQIGSEWGGAAS
jgi:hypothetical protein